MVELRKRFAGGFRLIALLLAIALGFAALSTAAWAQGTGGPQGTLPSTETARSLLMNNWVDTVAIHQARQLYKKDTHLFGPDLVALQSAIDWPVNQIDGATAFFHADVVGGGDNGQITGSDDSASPCESSGTVQGDDAAANPGIRQSYPSVMCFDDGGVLNVVYLRESQLGLPIRIEKSYAMVPNQHFLVVRYTVTNNVLPQYDKQVSLRIGEVAEMHNKAVTSYQKASDTLTDTGLYVPPSGQPVNDMRATWHPELNAWIVDMSASNGTFVVFGAFQPMDRHRGYEASSEQIPFDVATGSDADAVDAPQLPASVDQVTGKNVALSEWKQAVIDPGATQTYDFFYAVTSSLKDAQAVAQQALAPGSADAWFTATRQAYQSWLKQGREPSTSDPGLGKAFTRVLITDKQSQQPAFGSFVASTNPAYGYKVWPRDSSVTALSLAAAGHLDEAVKFYRWMASVQDDGSVQDHPQGTWYSNYSFWIRNHPKVFVEPEWDSLGLFMLGVYHTWQLLNAQDARKAQAFLTTPLDQGPSTIYEAVRRSAEFIRNNLTQYGFGPGDHSIWEEDFEWATFTQATYAAGLNAAHLLAMHMGQTSDANNWLNAAQRVLGAIQWPASDETCPGLWNDTEQRWNRGAYVNCTRDDRLDSSTDIILVLGLVGATDGRATSQRQAVISRLTNGRTNGIARYEGDTFYYTNPASPGGTMEATAAMPAWPQMDMYMSMLEHWQGLNDTSLGRLVWYAGVTNVGYMPPGEAVDWPTQRPLPSTSSEPVTGGWFMMALLNYLNVFDPRLPPLQP
jgi:hypothetical protein